ILPMFHPEILLRAIERQRITLVHLVPTHFNALLGLGDETLRRYDTSSLAALFSAGSPLAQATKERLVEHFGDVLHDKYGAAEVGIMTSIGPADQFRKPASVGRPFFATTIRVLDENGEEVPEGEVGELHARSPFMFSGYWKQPDETARRFRGGFYA